MTQPFYNDQAYIAEGFLLDEDFTEQTARLAFFKINSYKLSLMKSCFRETQLELKQNIRNSLFHYTDPGMLLDEMGFFTSEFEN